MWVLKVKVISWPWPKVIYIWKLAFSQKPLGQSMPNFICKLSGGKWKFIDMMVVTLPRWPPCPYMVKTLQKSSAPEPVDLFPWNLVCCIGDSCSSLFVQMMTVGWPWPILRQGQIWQNRLSYRKKWKLLIFRTFAACDLKPIEIMKIYEYWRSRSFLDLGPRSFTFENY